MEEDIILPDGSIKGKTFSGENYKAGYPTPLYGKETYEQYYARVEKLKKEGFHLGDLTWGDWDIYCKGYPGNEYYVQNEIIK
jgi:hypothetical protein